jgi:UDP-N-acetylmuramyl pentapeptide phosphotransferase/UDP-N-acetylglucosamine-1-phosphate transferase
MVIEFTGRNFTGTKNYRCNYIINSAGLFISINIILLCTASAAFSIIFPSPYKADKEIAALIIGVFSSSFTGFIDDRVNESTKGITGHIKCLLRGQITSGGIKAAAGVSVSLIICLIFGYTGLNLLLSMALISMMQNFINLLDLRPLRAVKAYTAFSFIYLLFGYNLFYTEINLGVLISLLFYIRYEASEACMMGDTGSNVLGVTLGILFASSRNIYLKTALLAFLIAAQVYAEKKSISKLIERNRILNYIDMLGRRKEFDKNTEGNC